MLQYMTENKKSCFVNILFFKTLYTYLIDSSQHN